MQDVQLSGAAAQSPREGVAPDAGEARTATTGYQFRLRFPPDEIPHWAAKYDYDDEIPLAVGNRARERGYLDRADFLDLALWKSARPKKRCGGNTESYVHAVTAAALSSTEPRFKIEVLRILDGVDWPTASVILHFCDRERWPIFDYRAFWSLSQDDPAGHYTFSLWDEYTRFIRGLADSAGVSMRSLDRALWAYSKEHQPVRRVR